MSKVESAGGDEIVTIELGFDRFEAHLLAEACRAEGCTVELLTMDDLGQAPGRLAGMPHRLLVWRSELRTVEAVIARSL